MPEYIPRMSEPHTPSTAPAPASFDPGQAFLDLSRHYLQADVLPRLIPALASLGDTGIWQRANPESNAAANYCLHLAGNARQWIVSGVGGAPDTRNRPAEFAATGGLTAAELIDAMRTAFAEIDATLARVTPAMLGASRHIQGRDTTVFNAIFHVVEHIAMHTGQIILQAKAWGTTPIQFYANTPDGLAKRLYGGSGI
jgi:uncharacterized damage-inducible protein DinB